MCSRLERKKKVLKRRFSKKKPVASYMPVICLSNRDAWSSLEGEKHNSCLHFT
ncbi:hypothetical protein NC652_024413 [Populus alba x Populus x berolinensis]|nr:hypothetical protein NC652_024413 [Populus alba x Populus x berolinensis]